MKLFVVALGLSLTSSAFCASSFSTHANELSNSFDLEAKSRLKESIQAIESAYAKDLGSYILNYRMGYLYSTAGLTANAIEYFDKAIAIQPKSLEALYGLMNVYVAKANWADAKKVAQKILAIDEHNYVGGWNLIRADIMLGKFQDALTLAETFLELYPTDQTLLVQKAMCLGYAKKNNEAMAAYKDVQALYPNDPTAKSALKAMK